MESDKHSLQSRRENLNKMQSESKKRSRTVKREVKERFGFIVRHKDWRKKLADENGGFFPDFIVVKKVVS